jgi:hypothetical protein
MKNLKKGFPLEIFCRHAQIYAHAVGIVYTVAILILRIISYLHCVPPHGTAACFLETIQKEQETTKLQE